MLLFASDALIFVWGPCSAGKNLEWRRTGFGYLSFTATSRVRRKYGSWSIAQGIRHGILDVVPNICGNEFENDGAAWTAAKWIFPILSLYYQKRETLGAKVEKGNELYESLNPKVAFAWETVICLDILEMFL
jgi:hypothetical protein